MQDESPADRELAVGDDARSLFGDVGDDTLDDGLPGGTDLDTHRNSGIDAKRGTLDHSDLTSGADARERPTQAGRCRDGAIGQRRQPSLRSPGETVNGGGLVHRSALAYPQGVSETYFQKGFGLKAAVGPVLSQNYASGVVDRLRALNHSARAGDVVLKLAREFGFCYGVDRAVEYAYETRQQFPDRRIFLSGEIIHNPDVNRRIEDMGIRILPERGDSASRYGEVTAGDVVILPAFGVTVAEMAELRAARLRARGHDLRQRAQRLEERPPVRPRRLHGRDPRQALPRGDQGHGVAGLDALRRPLPLRARPPGGLRRLRLHPRGGRGGRDPRALRRTRPARASTPSATWPTSGWPTRRRC